MAGKTASSRGQNLGFERGGVRPARYEGTALGFRDGIWQPLYTVCMNSNPLCPLPLQTAELPYVDGLIPAGFPSPAEDFDIDRLNLVDLLTPHPLTTFLWRVSGTSMIEAGIFDGDILVVDRSLQARHGDVIVAQIDNDFTVKYLHKRNGIMKLVPANATFPDIVPRDGQIVTVIGVVTAVIKQFHKYL